MAHTIMGTGRRTARANPHRAGDSAAPFLLRGCCRLAAPEFEYLPRGVRLRGSPPDAWSRRLPGRAQCPRTLLAELSHMLMKGFFFVQGLAITFPSRPGWPMQRCMVLFAAAAGTGMDARLPVIRFLRVAGAPSVRLELEQLPVRVNHFGSARGRAGWSTQQSMMRPGHAQSWRATAAPFQGRFGGDRAR